jgi:hypothetical protein
VGIQESGVNSKGTGLRLAVDLEGQSATGAMKPDACNLARPLANI